MGNGKEFLTLYKALSGQKEEIWNLSLPCPFIYLPTAQPGGFLLHVSSVSNETELGSLGLRCSSLIHALEGGREGGHPMWAVNGRNAFCI